MRVEPVSINTPAPSINPNSATKRIGKQKKRDKKSKDKVRKEQKEFIENIASNYDDIPYAYNGNGSYLISGNGEFDKFV